MTIKAGNVYFTITSQTPIKNSKNTISAAAVQTTLPPTICNNINVNIHLYCTGLLNGKHRMPCLITSSVRTLLPKNLNNLPLQNFKEHNHCEDTVVLVHAMKAHTGGVV
jgi:hypothetical protein